MARKKKYSLQDSVDLLTISEGRNSPKSGEPGHTNLQHVGGREEQVGGRLLPKISNMTNAPIILNPATGQVASKKEHVERYLSSGKFPSKNQSNRAFDAMYEGGKETAGTFMDLQQAYSVLQYALNSDEGQAALGKLDGGSTREFFSVSVLDWSMNRTDCWKMYTASLNGGGMSDMTHLEDFKSVTVGIDRMAIQDGVHLQTLYPCATKVGD